MDCFIPCAFRCKSVLNDSMTIICLSFEDVLAIEWHLCHHPRRSHKCLSRAKFPMKHENQNLHKRRYSTQFQNIRVAQAFICFKHISQPSFVFFVDSMRPILGFSEETYHNFPAKCVDFLALGIGVRFSCFRGIRTLVTEIQNGNVPSAPREVIEILGWRPPKI